MAQSVLEVTPGQKRFTFISMAIEKMTGILQELLSAEISPDNIKQTVKSHAQSFTLSKQQKVVLDHAARQGYSEFDITFLYTLLRNICKKIPKPTKGWGIKDMPSRSEVTVGDDIERIRIIRNSLQAHATSKSVEELQFEEYWKIMYGICLRMEYNFGGQHVQGFEAIKSRELDRKLVKKYEEALQCNFETSSCEDSYEALIAAKVNRENERRIILLGKVGAGKSASGNAILNKNVFESMDSWESVTRDCTYGNAEQHGLRYRIYDTPGANAPIEDEEVFQNEIKRCLYVTSPGFHCIALVISSSERITKEDQKMLKELDKLLGEDASKYIIIIFTKVKNEDNLGAKIGKSTEITELTTKCRGRYVSFGNDATNVPETAVRKFNELLTNLITRNARKHKICYEHKLYTKAHKILIKDMEEYIQDNPECTKENALEIVRQKAVDGLSKRDSELLALAKSECCAIL